VERVIRTLKEQCLHRCETRQHASRVISDWVKFYNTRRAHQALGMETPAQAYASAARPEQKTLSHYTLRFDLSGFGGHRIGHVVSLSISSHDLYTQKN